MHPSARLLRRSIVAVVVVMALGAALATPAGAATDPEEWGDTFCTATVGWLTGASQGIDQLLTDAFDPTLTAADGKQLILGFLGTGVDATKAYGKAVKAAGVPDIRNGAKIQAAILAGINESTANLAALEKAAKKMPLEPAAAYKKSVNKIGNQFSAFSDPWTKGMNKAGKLDKGTQLGDILATLPACAQLAGGSP
ncbi:MAG: hypothetical protein WDA60_11370 [Acidimicrobiia bacterium]|jgi:hypothetical protein